MSTRVISDGVYIDKFREIVGTNMGGRSEEPAQLLNHVWLGSQRNAESLRLLRKIGVTHVLNCAGYKGPRENPDANPYEGLNIDYKEFKADDEDSYDITQHFREAFNYLDRVSRLGGVCLVHCALGINRSAAICVAYIMMHKTKPLLETATFIKQRRRVMLSNAGFRRQLVRFARLKNLLDELPEEEYEEDVKRYTKRLTYGSYADDSNYERPSRSIDRDIYRSPRSSSLSSFSSLRSRESAPVHRVRESPPAFRSREGRPPRPPNTDYQRPSRTEYQRGDACLEYLYNRFMNREKF